MLTTQDGFRHEAALYSGRDDFLAQMTSFVRDGVRMGEPVLVVVIPEKGEALREALGRDANHVEFRDMAEIGRNPARIIPVWRSFLSEHAGAARVRGIGEPIWAGRSDDEIAESQRHEALINLAFQGFNGWILCPYDTEALPAAVLDEASRSHPVLGGDGSPTFIGLDAIAQPFDAPLAEPVTRPVEIPITSQLDAIRRFVARHAAAFGLHPGRVADLVLAVDEVATNTLRHAGGRGTLRTWVDGERLVFEVRDRGRIADPLVGRERPSAEEGGFGLWIVNQVCDLVQVRTYPAGSVVRLHMSRRV